MLQLQLPKNPGSIRYQFSRPASSPITNTIRTVTFSAVVVGLPAREGKRQVQSTDAHNWRERRELHGVSALSPKLSPVDIDEEDR